MKSHKEMIKEINSCVRKNFSKILVSLLITVIFSFVIKILSTVLTLTSFSSILGLVLEFFTIYVTVFLYYGLSVIIGNFYKNKPTILGDLLAGRQDSKRIGGLSLRLFGLIFLSTFIVSSVIMFFYFKSSNVIFDMTLTTDVAFEEVQEILDIFAKYSFVVYILLAFFCIPNILIFPVMYNNENQLIKNALQESRRIIKGKILNFIWFFLKTAKLPLLGIFFFGILGFFLPSIFTLIMYVITALFYITGIYLIFAINAYYYELIGYTENQEIEEITEILQIEENNSFEDKEC